MGDRGNIVVDFGDRGKIYLYTHSTGSDIGQILQDALNSPEGIARAHDESYLTRILFNHLTKDAYSPETGYGIAPYAPDNEHPLLIVCPERQTVRIGEDTISFADFRKNGAKIYRDANGYEDED